MDLLATVRKEGARGGRGDFKWSDVQSSTHRENYLGHSLMAPVGRWQKGRDLNWYAKGDAENQEGETDAERVARERKEEIKRVKEAEQDALAKALGFEVMPKNPNMEALGDRKEMDRILKASAAGQDDETSKGVGFGAYQGKIGPRPEYSTERMEGSRDGEAPPPTRVEHRHRKSHRRDRSYERRRSSRSRSRERRRRHDEKERRHTDRGYDERRRSKSRDRRRRYTDSRSPSRERRRGDRDGDDVSRRKRHRDDRSRSPYYRHDRERDDRRRRE